MQLDHIIDHATLLMNLVTKMRYKILTQTKIALRVQDQARTQNKYSSKRVSTNVSNIIPRCKMIRTHPVNGHYGGTSHAVPLHSGRFISNRARYSALSVRLRFPPLTLIEFCVCDAYYQISNA